MEEVPISDYLSIIFKTFTKAKTIQKIIQHSKAGNFIQLKPKLYKESIHLDKNMVLAGDIHDETIIEGLIIIPKMYLSHCKT